MSELDEYLRAQSAAAELTRHLARDLKDRSERARAEEKARIKRNKESRDRQSEVNKALGYGSW